MDNELADGEYAPSPREYVRVQVEQFERSGGEEGNEAAGLPVVIMTTRGARSGKIRKVPLMRVERDGRYLAVGSNTGEPTDPSWVHNVRAHPQVVLQDGAARHELVARLLSGAERREWWAHALTVFPHYAEYQADTEREFPVFVLESLPQ